MTGIPPIPVTIGSHTPPTSVTTPTRENLSKDVTWVEVEARLLSPVYPSIMQFMCSRLLQWEMYQ